MRILIDLQHPAELHVLKNLVGLLRAHGHTVRFTGRDKDILVDLAHRLGEDVQVFGRARKGVVHLAMELFYRQVRLARILASYKPDCILAAGDGAFIAVPAKLFRIPFLIFYDTEHATVANRISYPLATNLYVPDCYNRPIRRSHVRYPGYHALAYLHPARFTPDPSVLEEAGVSPGEPYVVVRYVAWGAGHDIGLHGLSPALRLSAVHALAEKARVFVSCEGDLPPELAPYRLRLPVHRMHHLLAFASLTFGESATMASEGAVLGVPGIYVDPVGRGYTDELERRYGLVFNFPPAREREALEKGLEILSANDPAVWAGRRARMLAEKIDVTRYFFEVVTGHPLETA